MNVIIKMQSIYVLIPMILLHHGVYCTAHNYSSPVLIYQMLTWSLCIYFN